jgi:hypothetical protein
MKPEKQNVEGLLKQMVHSYHWALNGQKPTLNTKLCCRTMKLTRWHAEQFVTTASCRYWHMNIKLLVWWHSIQMVCFNNARPRFQEQLHLAAICLCRLHIPMLGAVVFHLNDNDTTSPTSLPFSRNRRDAGLKVSSDLVTRCVWSSCWTLSIVQAFFL